LYIKEKDEEIIIMVVYVDDLIITGSSDDLVQEEKYSLCKPFDMNNLGLLHYCLAIEVWQQPNMISISSELLEKFKMEDCNPSKTPMEVNLKLAKDDEFEVVNELLYHRLIGGLICLTTTRSDITFAVGMLSRFLIVLRKHIGMKQR
jgi:hypothetical protein